MAPPEKHPDELRARAVRLYRELDPMPLIHRLVEQLGGHHEAPRNWIRQAEAEHDDRPTTTESEELRRLRRENAELKRANEILKAAERFSPRNSTRPSDDREARAAASRPLWGLDVVSSTCCGWIQRQANSSQHQRDDEELVAEIVDIDTTSGGTYGSLRVRATLPRRRSRCRASGSRG